MADGLDICKQSATFVVPGILCKISHLAFFVLSAV